MNYQEQHEAVQATLLQTIAAVGADIQGSNAQLLVLVVLLNRTDDANQGVRAVASDSLRSAHLLLPPFNPTCPLQPYSPSSLLAFPFYRTAVFVC